ncbi:protein-export chaperone SecB [Staphylococcus haemolyticus]|uniref:protein-export chaperone SecB n=1 Tax=Staphylococcus haemolyticus TaxID=1283 RepID=UPI001F0A16C4|nr:protein-export chaperone SecB [Staphylococcus haemolyticus]MCH4327284.1 protein-export chaperone SecB [Staphylococcus haemolyticus]
MDIIMNFKSFRLMNVELDTVNQEKDENDKTSLRVNAGTSDINEDGEGQLEIELNISEKEEGYSREIKIKVLGIFEFPNKENNNEYNLDEILKVNGTAILMPYIRTLLSSLTSFDDSTEHILLPALNVKSMFEQSESE